MTGADGTVGPVTGPPNELRRNPLTGRWVTIASRRASRPQDYAVRSLDVEASPRAPCPFCPGHEHLTPPALATYLRPDGRWLVRIVPNMYPAFLGDGATTVHAVDGVLHQSVPAAGLHEVMVIGPEHEGDLARLDDERLDTVVAGLADRLRAHAATPEVAYTQVIVNFGREAGASLEHPHAQLLGIPFVPREIDDELLGIARFASGRGDEAACLLCSTVDEERAAGDRIVRDEAEAVTIAPFWSGAPYEVLIVPTAHGSRLDAADPGTTRCIAHLVRDGIARLRRVLGDVAYNVVIHTAPHRLDVHYHWHIHLLPRTSTIAGFEQGTGVLINTVRPEDAAAHLAGAVRLDASAASPMPEAGN